MRDNNDPEGIAQTGDRLVEPLSGLELSPHFPWGSAARRARLACGAPFGAGQIPVPNTIGRMPIVFGKAPA